MRVPRRIVVAFGACALTAAALAAGPGVNLSGLMAAGSAAAGPASQALPDVTVRPGVMHIGRAQSSPPTTADCEKSYKVACYEPAQIEQAYNLPAPPSLRIISPAGKVPAYNPDNSDMVGWASETTLDVEYAHTVAPGANLLLVVTPVSETRVVQSGRPHAHGARLHRPPRL